MITTNNYTYSALSFNILQGNNVSSEVGTATMTLTPLQGYSIDVNDFAFDANSSDPNIDTVTLTQNGDNIDVEITFDGGYVMPADNTELNVCITGAGVLNEKSISGTITSIIPPDISGDTTETNTPYSATGAEGQTVLLFSRTYTADSGYLINLADIRINQNVFPPNYTIDKQMTHDANGNLTALTVNVSYTFPSNSVSGDIVFITLKQDQIYVVNQLVSRWTIPSGIIAENGDFRTLVVSGIPGAGFSITRNDGSGAIPLVTNEILDATGIFSITVPFDPVTSNTTHTFIITGDLVTGLNDTIVIEQRTNIDISVRSIGTDFSISADVIKEVTPLNTFDEISSVNTIDFGFTITPGSTGTLVLDRQPSLTDFTPSTIAVEAVSDENTDINVTSFDVVDASGLTVGMKFNEQRNELAPLPNSITAISNNTLTVEDPVTLNEGAVILFSQTDGTYLSLQKLNASLNGNTITVTGQFTINNSGNSNQTFTLNLDNFISQTYA